MNSSSKSLSPLITAPRMTAFSPGQSPPEVRIPIFMGGAHFRREPVGAGIGGAAAWPGGQDEPARASRRPNSTVRSGPAQARTSLTVRATDGPGGTAAAPYACSRPGPPCGETGAADVAGPPGSSDAGCRVLAGVVRVLVLVDRCGNGAPLWRPGIGLGADLAPALGGALQGVLEVHPGGRLDLVHHLGQTDRDVLADLRLAVGGEHRQVLDVRVRRRQLVGHVRQHLEHQGEDRGVVELLVGLGAGAGGLDRKRTRLNSSHVAISYAVFCLKK